jgi:hypothetical protein
MAVDDGSRAWSKEIRAEPRRRGGRQTSRWLMEEGGGRSTQDDFHHKLTRLLLSRWIPRRQISLHSLIIITDHTIIISN